MATPRKSKTSEEKKPVLYIKTFGCQMNEYDTELIANLFEQAGYACTESLKEADVILYNTCSVREHAEARVWGQAGMLGKFKRENNCSPSFAEAKLNRGAKMPIIGILGCMAQNYQDKIFQRLPHVDIVCGTGNIYDLPHLVDKVRRTGKRILAVDGNQRPHAIGPCGKRKNMLKAFVTITEGCNNYCSYCIVPYVRSGQVSRVPEDILNEINYLADNGVKEITLLGQNVNSYGQDLDSERITFIKLLNEASKIAGLERVRFTTNHPKDTNAELFKVISKNKKICPHLHLPLQSGSDRVLKAMNRKYTSSWYSKLVNLYRKYVEFESLTTDIVVGFPGETDKDFKATFDLMKEIAFDNAFIFKYSSRPPAAASFLKDDVPQEVKRERNQMLLELQKNISLNKNRLYLGREVDVLVEGPDKTKRNLIGRTATNKVAVFNGDDNLTGKIQKVMVKDVTENTLIAGLTK